MKKVHKKRKYPRKKDPFIPGAKFLRCLQMIAYLQDRRMTIDEMATKFDMSVRTTYRYIELFEAVGYCIDKDFYGKYFIFAGPIIRTNKETHQKAVAESPSEETSETNP